MQDRLALRIDEHKNKKKVEDSPVTASPLGSEIEPIHGAIIRLLDRSAWGLRQDEKRESKRAVPWAVRIESELVDGRCESDGATRHPIWPVVGSMCGMRISSSRSRSSEIGRVERVTYT